MKTKNYQVSKDIFVSNEQHLYMNKLIADKRRTKIIQIIILAGILLFWEITARLGILNDFIFSSPSRIITCFFSMCCDGTLYHHLFITIYETFVCFTLVIIIGMFTAILMWLSKGFSDVIEPYIVTLNSLPKSALAPILIVWLGNNMTTIIVSAISVAVFGTTLTLYTGFMETDKDEIKLVQTFGGNRFHILTKVLLPGNIPIILSTMKVNLGLSLVGVIIGEFLAAREGLGYLIIYGSQVFKMDWVIMSIILLCLISMLLYKAINIISTHSHK